MTLPIATDSRVFISEANSYWSWVGHPLNALAGSDPDGGTLRFSLAPGGAPDRGRVLVAPDGTFMYRPAGDAPLSDSFVYRVTDPTGGSDTATVSIRIEARAPALLKGTAGNDMLLADGGANVLYGYGGSDYLDGDGGNDLLYGGAGHDVLRAGSGRDSAYGGGGNDRIRLELGTTQSRADGGTGSDVLELMLRNDGPTTIRLDGGDVLVNGVRVGTGFESLLVDGLFGPVSMTGGAGADTFRGGWGNDTVSGGDGDDHLSSGGGDDESGSRDRLFGGAGHDRIALEYEDDVPFAHSASGGSGTDVLAITDFESSADVDEEDGGGPELPAALPKVTITLTATGSVVMNGRTVGSGFERLEVSGLSGPLTATGGAGNDVLQGAGRGDRLIGGGGNDLIGFWIDGDTAAPLGGSTAQGGAGRDQLIIDLDDTFDAVHLRASGDRAIFDGVTVGSGFESFAFRGGSGADSLAGGAGADSLWGGRGVDRLAGGGGNDLLRFTVEKGATQAADIVLGWGAVAGNDDRIEIDLEDLEASALALGLPNGALASRHFRSGLDNRAQDSDDRLIFRTTDESLWWDRDGSGSATAVKLADFQDGVRLAAADIRIGGLIWGTDLIEG